MSGPSDIPHKEVKLSEADVPGAILKHANIAANSVLELRRFLKCRGIKCDKIKKRDLIKRVEICKENCDEISLSVDKGIWAAVKEKECRSSALQTRANYTYIFPITGWKKFPSQTIPKFFCYGSIYHYLVETAILQKSNEELYYATIKPTTKGKQFFKSGHITNLQDCLTFVNNHYCIKSDVIASMSNDVKYKVAVMLEHEWGKVLDASCECRASQMGRCSHVAGVLFALEDYVNLFGNSSVSCTSQLCGWNQGRKEKSSTEVMKRQYSNKRKISEIYQFKADARPTNEEESNNNLLNVCKSYPETTMWELLLSYKYEDYSICIDRFQVLQQNIFSLQKNLLFNLTCSGEVPNTTQQNQSVRWKEIRKLLITASVCSQFINIDDTDTDKLYSLLKVHMWFPQPFTNKYTQHGINNESSARVAYSLQTGNTVQETGLWINPDYAGLGASPDGLVYDETTKTYGLLEIKCPYVLKDYFPHQIDKLTTQQRYSCCLSVDDNLNLFLKKNHKYYQQIQMQMAICEKKWCDFVIWTPKGINIERIQFDPVLWAQMSKKLLDFHFSYLCLEYFEQRIPRKLKPIKFSPHINFQ